MNAEHRTARGDFARRPILIGDHIEVPGNMDCLRAAAEMFDWEFNLFDSDDHSSDIRALSRSGLPIVAIENTRHAENLFQYRPPDGPLAIIVGNERKGISRQVLRLADHVVQIPIASVHVNTLNVAAAAAVALYYLSRARKGRIGALGGRGRSRPEVMLTGATDAIELGSAVRSAACFGWTRLHIDDRHAT
jgi:tRNA G18 (ribose-2'-O)-methylase SpoU